ncbi:MAG: hypothetical protein C0448_03750 [Sphingobacteriaceae bacterium]|nr:hypothetical protein [Sphingobacteriaceae bacterium]
MKRYYFTLLFLGILLTSVIGQSKHQSSKEIAEMLNRLHSTKTEKEKLKAFVELAWMYRSVNTNIAKDYSDSTIILATKLKEYKSCWFGLNSKAEALRISGNLTEALKIHQLAFTLAETNHLTIKTAHSLNNIGLVLKRQRNPKEAIDYILKARNLYQSVHDTDGIITTSTNLGNCYYSLDDYNTSTKYHDEVISLSIPREDYYSLGNAYTNLGHNYYYMGQKNKAKDSYYKGLQYREKYGDLSDLADSYSNYGYMVYEDGNYAEANNYFQKALAIDRHTGNKDRLLLVYKYLSEMWVTKKDFESAYYYADSARIYKDSIINETNVSSLNEMSQKFDSEKKQLKIERLSTENSFKEKENKLQKVFLLVVGIALIISIILGISVLKQYRDKKKANHIIIEQKEILEEKQKEIIDSITYAKHLQEAILPTEKIVKDFLPESFIFYKPKDIVAGDFYWFEHKEDLIFIAAADCTGHGVPGAMVSVVCSNALNRVVKEFNTTNPGAILDKTRELVLETFVRSDKDVKDGMDISLCCINSKTKQLLWSGANNPLWYIQNNEMKEITANKQSVGKTEDPKPFITHQIQLQKGDSIYLFTDGYADQFGGPKGKKLKYKPFKELLFQNSNLPLENQKQKLEQTFNDWKLDLEQVDDVCVIGVRL